MVGRYSRKIFPPNEDIKNGQSNKREARQQKRKYINLWREPASKQCKQCKQNMSGTIN